MAFESTLIVGCGNMAGAMLEGWLAAGLPRKAFTVVTPSRESVPGNVELLREVPEGRQFDSVLLSLLISARVSKRLAASLHCAGIREADQLVLGSNLFAFLDQDTVLGDFQGDLRMTLGASAEVRDVRPQRAQ